MYRVLRTTEPAVLIRIEPLLPFLLGDQDRWHRGQLPVFKGHAEVIRRPEQQH